MSIQELGTEQAVELITCVIDGFEVTVPKGTLVIRAAEKLGIHEKKEKIGELHAGEHHHDAEEEEYEPL